MSAAGPTTPGAGRVSSLDGLRGLAALVVAISHALYSSAPALVGTSPEHAADAAFPSAAWWLADTPLRVVWAGGSAVIVFFVLSGFVLALPFLRAGTFDAAGYYPRRLIRLYLPVWGALALAALLHVAIERTPAAGGTWFLGMHAAPLSGTELARDALLLFEPGSYATLTAIWSLKWEVIFSLALPLYLLVARRAAERDVSWIVAVACLALITVASNGYTAYLPCFMLGTLMAFERHRVERAAGWLRGPGRSQRTLRVLLPIACALALVPELIPGSTRIEGRLSVTLVAAGASLAVLLALVHEPVQRFMRRPAVQWLGVRSFSLYLVHEPVLVTLGFALGGRPQPVLFTAVSLALSLLIADAFFRAVERPAHTLSRRVGRRLGNRAQPREATA